MDQNIANLKDADAISVLRRVAHRWLDNRGAEVFSVFEDSRKEFGNSAFEALDWLDADPSQAEERLAVISREALDAILSGEDGARRVGSPMN